MGQKHHYWLLQAHKFTVETLLDLLSRQSLEGVFSATRRLKGRRKGRSCSISLGPSLVAINVDDVLECDSLTLTDRCYTLPSCWSLPRSRIKLRIPLGH
jgi:hypothetical protein